MALPLPPQKFAARPPLLPAACMRPGGEPGECRNTWAHLWGAPIKGSSKAAFHGQVCARHQPGCAGGRPGAGPKAINSLINSLNSAAAAAAARCAPPGWLGLGPEPPGATMPPAAAHRLTPTSPMRAVPSRPSSTLWGFRSKCSTRQLCRSAAGGGGRGGKVVAGWGRVGSGSAAAWRRLQAAIKCGADQALARRQAPAHRPALWRCQGPPSARGCTCTKKQTRHS